MVLGPRRDDPGPRRAGVGSSNIEILLAASPAAVVAVDLSGTVTDWNPAAERLFGWQREEVLGRSDPTVTDDPRYGPLFRQAAGGEIITGVELRSRRRDGTVRELGGSLAPIRNPEGRVVEVVKMLTDYTDFVTDSRLAHDALRHSEQFFNAVFEGSPAAKQIFSVDGTLLRTNEVFRRFMGLPSRDHGVGTWNILTDVAAQNLGLAGAFRLALDGEIVELPDQAADLGRIEGQTRSEPKEVHYDAAFFPINDETGAVRAVALTLWDTTDRKKAEAALHESERFADAIFERSPVAIQIYDPEGTSRRLNEAHRRLLGLPSIDYSVGAYNVLTDELAQGYGIADRFRRALAGEVVEHTDQVVDLGHPGNLWNTDRRRIVINQVFFPIHDEKGAVRAVVAMAWDNTTRAEAERALRRLAQAQTDFVSTVSHELRTPLTSVRGALALLAGNVTGPLPEPARPLVDIALRNSERLLMLINDLLDIQRIESASLDLNLQEVELTPLIERALEDNHAFGAELGVTFHLIHGEPGLRVQGDPNRLLQLLANLMSNAAKFSPPQGTVEIAAERHDGWARVAVRDHGPGIPEEFRCRIFNRFAQADSSNTRQKGGTGLGLSICKALVERMGGRIGFETRTEISTETSTETDTEPATGHGTTFHFDLPLLDSRSQADGAG
jgi:PAS domain S-box-containing protein